MSKICRSTTTKFGIVATCLKALANNVVRKAKDVVKLTEMKAQLYATISSIDGLITERLLRLDPSSPLIVENLIISLASQMSSRLFISFVFL